MGISHDPETDTATFTLHSGTCSPGESMTSLPAYDCEGGFAAILDYDLAGRLIHIEVLGAEQALGHLLRDRS